MAKNRKKDKNIALSLIWFCIGCSLFLLFKNWTFFAVGIVMSGILYIKNN